MSEATFLSQFAEQTIRGAVAATVNNMVGEAVSYESREVQDAIRKLFFRQMENAFSDPDIQAALKAKLLEGIGNLNIQFPARRY